MDQSSFVVPTAALARLDEAALRRVATTYSNDFGDPDRLIHTRRFPQRIASVGHKALARLTIIKASESLSESLCFFRKIGARSISPSLWDACSHEIFCNLGDKDLGRSDKNLQSDTRAIMSVAGSMITTDLRYFKDQEGFTVTAVLDTILHGEIAYADEWHADIDENDRRTYIMRTKRPTEFLDSCKLRVNPYGTKKDLCDALLERARKDLPQEDVIGLEKQFECAQLNDRRYHEEGALDNESASALAQRLGVLRQPCDGDIVMIDKTVWHRSTRPKPHEAVASSVLVRVGIL